MFWLFSSWEDCTRHPIRISLLISPTLFPNNYILISSPLSSNLILQIYIQVILALQVFTHIYLHKYVCVCVYRYWRQLGLLWDPGPTPNLSPAKLLWTDCCDSGACPRWASTGAHTTGLRWRQAGPHCWCKLLGKDRKPGHGQRGRAPPQARSSPTLMISASLMFKADRFQNWSFRRCIYSEQGPSPAAQEYGNPAQLLWGWGDSQ